jgi:glutaredoxin
MDERDIYSIKPSTIVMYSASWCPDCKRSKKFLNEHGIKFLDVDIGRDNEAFLFVEKLTRRVRIPTLVFPDAAIMIEPTDKDLAYKLGISQP